MENNNVLVLGTVFSTFVGAILTLAFANNNKLQRWLAFGASLTAWACTLAVLILAMDGQPQVYRMGAYQAPIGTLLVADLLAALFGVMASSVMLAGFMYSLHCRDRCVTYPSFLPLFLFMQTGLMGCFYTGDLFTFFVFIEIMVLSSVSLVAISDDRLGLEAAFKYLFISAIGTLLLLLGISAMYGTFGTLNLADMARQLQGGERPLLATGAAIFLTSAFLLKSAVFPFHFWQPDFHTTAPTPVHAVLSSVVVKVGIYGVIRLITLLFQDEAAQIESVLLVLGVIGIFFGSWGALSTYNGKRLLAYSTIGQIGFILVGIGWGTPLALVAAIVYAFNHAFIKSAMLMIMGLISSRTYPKSADFKDIGGVGTKLPPIVGAMWFIGGMALAGVPPLNGFISKLAIVQSGVDRMDWVPLFLAVFAGFITLMYVFRTWQEVFQTKVEQTVVKVKGYTEGDSVLAPALLIAVCIVLGLYARPLIVIAELAVQQVGDPTIYINAVKLLGG